MTARRTVEMPADEVECGWCLEDFGWCTSTGGPNPCEGADEAAACLTELTAAPLATIAGGRP